MVLPAKLETIHLLLFVCWVDENTSKSEVKLFFQYHVTVYAQIFTYAVPVIVSKYE